MSQLPCNSDADSRLMAQLLWSVRSMEKQLGAFGMMVGFDQTPEQSLVPVISVTRTIAGSSFTATLTWESTPGEFFSIQTSQDAVTWGSVFSPFPAAPDPATTTSWTSGGFLIDDLPRYFRVRRYPTAFEPC